MKMNSRMRGVVLCVLPMMLAVGCELDKQSLGDPDDATADSGEDTDGATSGSSATSSAGPGTEGTSDTTDGPLDGGCGPNVCGACAPGCEALDSCVDGQWECDCQCETDGPVDPEPTVCSERPIVAASHLAYRFADLPTSGGGGGDTSTTDGPGLDPDTVVIRFGTEALACGETPTYACDNWQVSIVIPPQYLEPGVYDLDDTDISVGYSIQGAQQSQDPEDCSFGGGGGGGGILEILAIDDDTIHAAFCSADLFEISADGVFTAQRC